MGAVCSSNQKIKCDNCHKIIDYDANFCKYCGAKTDDHENLDIWKNRDKKKENKKMNEDEIIKQYQQENMENQIINDAEFQKKIANEHHYNIQEIQQNEGPIKQRDITKIQQNIKNLQQSNDQHRCYDNKTKCWFFGFISSGDYKQIWSSVWYWRTLMTSNKKLCTNNMNFLKTEHCCKKCQKIVEELNQNKRIWEKLIEEQYPFVRDNKN